MKWRISHMCPQANKTEALRDWFPVNAWFPGDRSLPLQHRSSAKNLSPPSSQWTCCSESAGLSPLWSLRPKDSASQTTSRLAQLATVCVSHTAHPLLSARVLSCFSRVRLCDRVDCSPPGSSVRGILQAIILEWAAVPPLQGIFWPEDGTRASCISWYIAGGFFTNEPPREAPLPLLLLHKLNIWSFKLVSIHFFRWTEQVSLGRWGALNTPGLSRRRKSATTSLPTWLPRSSLQPVSWDVNKTGGTCHLWHWTCRCTRPLGRPRSSSRGARQHANSKMGSHHSPAESRWTLDDRWSPWTVHWPLQAPPSHIICKAEQDEQQPPNPRKGWVESRKASQSSRVKNVWEFSQWPAFFTHPSSSPSPHSITHFILLSHKERTLQDSSSSPSPSPSFFSFLFPSFSLIFLHRKSQKHWTGLQ